MNVAIYARVSTERQHDRGTIGSQLAALRQRAATEGDQVAAEFCDDGYSGARLDRPGLDGLRDAAEAGLVEAVWCLSPDRLSRVYAYQVIVLDELARHGVTVRFADAPALDDDPQARLLTQVQGVIAEYERARSPSATGAASCGAPARARSSPGKPPTATDASPAASTDPPTWWSTSPKRRSCGASSTTTPPAGTPCARSPGGSTPTRCPPRPASRSGACPPSGGCCATTPTSAGLLQPHRDRAHHQARPPPHPPAPPHPRRVDPDRRAPHRG